MNKHKAHSQDMETDNLRVGVVFAGFIGVKVEVMEKCRQQ